MRHLARHAGTIAKVSGIATSRIAQHLRREKTTLEPADELGEIGDYAAD